VNFDFRVSIESLVKYGSEKVEFCFFQYEVLWIKHIEIQLDAGL
jgi:hypothetical protein